ncbi:MAG: hypothetical protein AAGB06_06255 [Verrucomicrobiota bacterium]
MGKDSINLLAAMVGVFMMFAGGYFLMNKMEEEPPVVDSIVTGPTEYFVSLPKFAKWLETPLQVHVLKQINKATLDEIKKGEDIVRRVLFDGDAAQDDLLRITQALDFACRDVVPKSNSALNANSLESRIIEFEMEDLADVEIPRRPQPSKHVEIPVAHDFERMMRGFYVEDYDVLQRSFKIKSEGLIVKYSGFDVSSGVSRKRAATLSYVRNVDAFFAALSRFHDRYQIVQSTIDGTNRARVDWSKFKEESIPGLVSVIVGGASESVQVDPTGKVEFSEYYSSSTYFIGELDIRGNKVFLLLGHYADPRLKILWSHKNSA